jgi:hypothetical protein
MAGGTQGRRGMAAAVIFLSGCVGLGDFSAETLKTKQPPPPANKAEPAAQTQSEIPLVPLPSLSPPVVHITNANPSPSPERAAPQPDGSKQTPPYTARQLLERAAEVGAKLDSYIVRLTRREHLKGKGNAEEIIAFSFRAKPFSIHFKWLGDTAKGREVVYVKDRFGNKIHTKVAQGDAPLVPAGARLSLSPDNPLVRAASRHPITEAGVGQCVASLKALLDAQDRGDHRRGTLTVLEPQKRAEFPQPVETLERLIPPGVEPELPRGGRRLIYFDPEWHLPMLVITYDDKGNEVEYYRYDRLMTPAHLDDDDFNPDKLWAAPAAKPDSARPRRKQG